MSEKAYEKHTWILLFASGVSILIVGLVHLSQGLIGQTTTGRPLSEVVTSDARATNYIKLVTSEYGLVTLFLSFFIIDTALKSYRKAEKWAWYVFWSLPSLAVVALLLLGLSPPAIVILVLSFLGLLLPYRKFFPRR